MTAAQGVVRVCQEGPTATFQVSDRATMVQSHGFRRRAEQLLAGGVCTFRVDLRRCTHIDSTFVGTLLFLKRGVDGKPEATLTLLAPSPQARRVLDQMGVSAILPVADEECPAGPWEELDTDNPDLCTVKTNVTQAHEELARLPGPAGDSFRGVMRCLARTEDGDKRS